jgi:hypothetical protein
MTNTTYTPIWISTDQQIAALTMAHQTASITSKLIGKYQLPGDAAFLQGIVAPWMRLPVVMIAQGTLNISDTSISYEPKKYRAFGWSFKSSYENIPFKLSLEDVFSIEPADVKSPVLSMFDIPFTRIKTREKSPLNNVLLCVGGRISMPRIRSRSHELRQNLLSWHRNEITIT